jgi:lipid II isoglutaminyl synthase (glutamine-hydrolysing)
MRLPLTAEILAARAIGGLSRLTGSGGGTTIPGKILWKLDPGAVDRLAARLPRGSLLVSATNGKTTTTAMVAEIIRPHARLAHNHAGANLVSGVASALLNADGAELGLFEVDEAAFPEVAERLRPRAVCLGNLFRDQLDRYGELELVAERWRRAVDRLPASACVVVNGDDPQTGDLGAEHPHRTYGIDDPSQALPALPHAADSRYCIRCGTAYEYAAAYMGHLGDYRCPKCGHRRPALDVVARDIRLRGLDGSSFELVLPEGSGRVELPLPGLYNVYNALGAAALADVAGAAPEEVRAGLERFSAAFGRFERIAAGERTILVLLIKNPVGANEVLRTLMQAGTPTLLLVALNDAVADGRDVSWIWDVDFEPLLEDSRLERIVASGERAAELSLRFKYAGYPQGSVELVEGLEDALARGLELTPAGGELVVLATYTAMLSLRDIVTRRGLVRPYWERAA